MHICSGQQLGDAYGEEADCVGDEADHSDVSHRGRVRAQLWWQEHLQDRTVSKRRQEEVSRHLAQHRQRSENSSGLRNNQRRGRT